MARLRKINGRYYAYFYDRDRTPKEKSYPLGVSLKSAAQDLLRRKERAYARGEFDPWHPTEARAALSVKQAFDAFVESRRERCRPATVETYDTILRVLRESLSPGLPIAHVGPEHLREYLLDEKAGTDDAVKKSTLRMRYRHVRACFNWLEGEGYIDRNPVDEIEPPKAGEKVPKFLTPSQLDRLLRGMDAYREMRMDMKGRTPKVQWLKDVILVAVCTGLRLGELAALRWDAVDFESGFLTVRNRDGEFTTKSGSERSVPLIGDAKEVLERLAEEEPERVEAGARIFRSATGKPLRKDKTSKRFKFYVRQAKLPEYIHFHSLRHTTASWLVQKGVSLPIVQAILGHSSIQVTQRYAHLAPDVLVQAMQHTFGNGR